jgi:hypothetical protein
MQIDHTYTHIGRIYVPVAVLRPTCSHDIANYREVLAGSLAALDAGAHALVVDLSRVDRLGTAGLVALYGVARLSAGAAPPNADDGWAALWSIAEMPQQPSRLAVVRPHPAITTTMARPPYSGFLAVYTDLDVALLSLSA